MFSVFVYGFLYYYHIQYVAAVELVFFMIWSVWYAAVGTSLLVEKCYCAGIWTLANHWVISFTITIPACLNQTTLKTWQLFCFLQLIYFTVGPKMFFLHLTMTSRPTLCSQMVWKSLTGPENNIWLPPPAVDHSQSVWTGLQSDPFLWFTPFVMFYSLSWDSHYISSDWWCASRVHSSPNITTPSIVCAKVSPIPHCLCQSAI